MKKLEFAKLLELAMDECINITNMAKEKGEELFNSINDGLDDNPEYKYYLYPLITGLSDPNALSLNSLSALSSIRFFNLSVSITSTFCNS